MDFLIVESEPQQCKYARPELTFDDLRDQTRDMWVDYQRGAHGAHPVTALPRWPDPRFRKHLVLLLGKPSQQIGPAHHRRAFCTTRLTGTS